MNKAEEYLKENGIAEIILGKVDKSHRLYNEDKYGFVDTSDALEDYYQQRLKELTKGLNDSTKKLFISSNKDYASGYVFGVEKSIQLINSCKSK